jgi:hypothetical protein
MLFLYSICTPSFETKEQLKYHRKDCKAAVTILVNSQKTAITKKIVDTTMCQYIHKKCPQSFVKELTVSENTLSKLTHSDNLCLVQQNQLYVQMVKVQQSKKESGTSETR